MSGTPSLALLEDRLADGVGLLGLVEAGPQRGHAVASSRVDHSVFSWRCGLSGDHRVRRVEDRRGRAVVLLEPHDRGAGEPFGELEDVAHGRRAEPVDRLRVVADDGEVARRAVGRRMPLEDVGLQRVRVLVLVDEHVVEHLGELRSASR